MVKNLSAMHQTQVQFMGWEDPLEKEMATHSSVLAWNHLSWIQLTLGKQFPRYQEYKDKLNEFLFTIPGTGERDWE